MTSSLVKVISSLSFFIMAVIGLYSLYNVSKKKKPKKYLRSFCDYEDNAIATLNGTALKRQVIIDYLIFHIKYSNYVLFNKTPHILSLDDNEYSI